MSHPRVAAFLFCALATTAGCAPVVEPAPLAVVTWNVANLFNDRRDSPEVLSETVAGSAEYHARVAAIRDVVGGLDADVIVLQEVENAAVTADLAHALGGYDWASTSQGNDPRGIDNAVLSRWPVTEVRSHAAEVLLDGTSYARDCHEVHLDLDGTSLVVLAVHFKATEAASSAARRYAEAARTADIAAGLDGYVLIAGDFNAQPEAPELEPLAEHASLASELPVAERSTHASGRTLDDQRPNAALYAAYRRGSVRVVRSGRAAQVSDHWPLLAAYEPAR